MQAFILLKGELYLYTECIKSSAFYRYFLSVCDTSFGILLTFKLFKLLFEYNLHIESYFVPH